MKAGVSLSREAWILLLFLDLCALGAVSLGVEELLASKWLNALVLSVTGAGLIWLNTPSRHRKAEHPASSS